VRQYTGLAASPILGAPSPFFSPLLSGVFRTANQFSSSTDRVFPSGTTPLSAISSRGRCLAVDEPVSSFFFFSATEKTGLPPPSSLTPFDFWRTARPFPPRTTNPPFLTGRSLDEPLSRGPTTFSHPPPFFPVTRQRE